MDFTCFLGIRSAETGFTSPFGHVLIHFNFLNTPKPVLKFPKVRFFKGMRLTVQIALLAAWRFLNLQALSLERAGWAGRNLLILLLSDKMRLLSVKVAIGDRLMAFVRSATDIEIKPNTTALWYENCHVI